MTFQAHQWNRLKDLPAGTQIFLEGEPVYISHKRRREDKTVVVMRGGKNFTVRDLSLLSTGLVVDKP